MGMIPRQRINKDNDRAILWPCNRAYALRAENAVGHVINKPTLNVQTQQKSTYQPRGDSILSQGKE